MRLTPPRSLYTAPLVLSYSDGAAVLGYQKAKDLDAIAQDYGLEEIAYNPQLQAAQIKAAPNEIQLLARGVGSDARLRYVEPLADAHFERQRNDPATYAVDPGTGVPYQWWFTKIGLDRALNLSFGSASTLVGVIDTGVSPGPDLQGKVAESFYDRNLTVDSLDRVGHGTFVSSIIAANNDDGLGLGGTCGACRVVVAKASPDVSTISNFASASAIRFIADRGIRVLNLSYGGSCSQIEFEALKYAIEQKGVLVVASSGNEGAGMVSCPAAFLQPGGGGPSVGLAVGASDYNGNKATFSNYGSELSLVAPGTYSSTCGIFSAIPAGVAFGCARYTDAAHGTTYAYSSGTSFSAPMVAGVAALVLAARPDLSYGQVADLLKRSASIGQWTPDRGWGVLDAARALELATGRSSADPACADGVDNDGDGLIDYPADPGCSGGTDSDETNAAPPPKDQRAPTVRALAGKYRPGAPTDLYYRVRDNSGETRDLNRIYSASGRTLGTIRSAFGSGSDGSVFTVTWRAPKTAKGTLRHCVRAWDRAGNASGWSCAALRPLRKG